LEQIGGAVAAGLRETDTTGWYQQAFTIGVILTALRGASKETIESVVGQRIKTILSQHLGDALAQSLPITCHVYPDRGISHQVFYPDAAKQDFDKKFPVIIKRVIDISGSTAALVVGAPLFLLIAAVIKLTTPGPVFFKQTRLGQFGTEFTFLKFRSMYVNNNPAIHREYVDKLIEKKIEDSAGIYKIKNDPRVTRIGRFLRKSSLDELPQFINVLKGEMSLVGPRPPIPYEFEKYLPWHRQRIIGAKPGITGEWQVHGRSRTTFDEMIRMDLRYVRNQSVWLDLKILLKTPLAVLSGNGAH
jgi:lipopolysaccharide/colanic/teichoic acid biosynthesis glycosyltransferase